MSSNPPHSRHPYSYSETSASSSTHDIFQTTGSADTHPLEFLTSESAVIHQMACVEAPCRIGERTHVLQFSHVMSRAMIGNDCLIGHHTTIGSGVLIGNDVRVMNNTLLTGGVILEDGVFCGPSTVFAQMNRIRGKEYPVSKISPTLIRQGTSIGPNSTIAVGLTLGRYCFVEAGAVIDRSMPDYAHVAGNPAKPVGWQCECGYLLKFKQDTQTRCTHCGKQYVKTEKYRIARLVSGNNV